MYNKDRTWHSQRQSMCLTDRRAIGCLLWWHSGVFITRPYITRYCMYSTAVYETEHKSEFTLTKDTPYFALTGELWDVYCEDCGENWARYNSITLYFEENWLCNNRIVLAMMHATCLWNVNNTRYNESLISFILLPFYCKYPALHNIMKYPRDDRTWQRTISLCTTEHKEYGAFIRHRTTT